MIQKENCLTDCSLALRRKSYSIFGGALLLELFIFIAFTVAYFVLKNTNKDEVFRFIILAMCVLFNLIFAYLAVVQGYVIHLVSFLVMNTFFCLNFIVKGPYVYIYYYLKEDDSTYQVDDCILFGIMMIICIIIMIICYVLAAPLYKRAYSVLFTKIGASGQLWTAYTNISFFKSFTLLSFLCSTFLVVTSFFYLNPNDYEFYLIESANVCLLICFIVTVQLMINKGWIRLFIPVLCIFSISVAYQIYELICLSIDRKIFLEIEIDYESREDKFYAAHPGTYSLICGTIIVAHTLSYIYAFKYNSVKDTPEYALVLYKLGYTGLNPQYKTQLMEKEQTYRTLNNNKPQYLV